MENIPSGYPYMANLPQGSFDYPSAMTSQGQPHRQNPQYLQQSLPRSNLDPSSFPLHYSNHSNGQVLPSFSMFPAHTQESEFNPQSMQRQLLSSSGVQAPNMPHLSPFIPHNFNSIVASAASSMSTLNMPFTGGTSKEVMSYQDTEQKPSQQSSIEKSQQDKVYHSESQRDDRHPEDLNHQFPDLTESAQTAKTDDVQYESIAHFQALESPKPSESRKTKPSPDDGNHGNHCDGFSGDDIEDENENKLDEGSTSLNSSQETSYRDNDMSENFEEAAERSMSSPELLDTDTQHVIQLSKPSLKHTIKKYPPRACRESRTKPKGSKQKTIFENKSSSVVANFIYLGKFGDQTPWSHHKECILYEFFECEEFITSNAYNDMDNDSNQNISENNPESKNPLTSTPMSKLYKSQNNIQSAPEAENSNTNEDSSHSVPRSNDDKVETSKEDCGVVFPGMDLNAAVSQRTGIFQVQPDLDDLYNDKEKVKRTPTKASMQATKEKLDMERMGTHVKVMDSQCILIEGHKRWQCNQCHKNYTTKHNLVTHILDHLGIKPHLCMVCGKYFKQLSHLNTHMLTHDNIKPHVCQLCGKSFTQVSHLKRHQTVHLENKPNICDICNRGFAYPSELRVHKEKHVPGRDRCGDCGEDFGSPRALKQHLLTHEQREDLTCHQCGRTFRYPSQLRDHVVTHSGNRPFICTECGMDFMKEHHLKAHMFTHTGLRPYSCKECGRAFNQKANLQRHLLIHSAERAYRCGQCDKTFTQPQTLKAHMVVHADKKPYWCSICGKEFGRLHNLQGHMHMHNNSKPYVCFCGSSFTLKGNLNRHKKVKHGLNESTESMEEEAVNFLSLMSERVKEENMSEDELDSPDLLPEGSDTLDSSTDAKSHRRERKSTPRKIPRARKSTEFEENKDLYDGEEDYENEGTSKYFKGNMGKDHSSSHKKQNSLGEEEVSGSQRSFSKKVGSERGDDSCSDSEDEVKGEADEEDWSPKSKRQCLKRGGKIDSIIAKKFQNV